MGLDVSHDCWSGAYSAFHRWREAIAKAAGKPPLMTMTGFNGSEGYLSKGDWWEHYSDDPLKYLLCHSDCDGDIATELCGPIADRLEALLPELEKLGDGGGHVGNYRAKTQRFIDGLRAAAAAGENVEFH